MGDDGAITAVFSRPSIRKTVQIKGKDAVVGGLFFAARPFINLKAR